MKILWTLFKLSLLPAVVGGLLPLRFLTYGALRVGEALSTKVIFSEGFQKQYKLNEKWKMLSDFVEKWTFSKPVGFCLKDTQDLLKEIGEKAAGKSSESGFGNSADEKEEMTKKHLELVNSGKKEDWKDYIAQKREEATKPIKGRQS